MTGGERWHEGIITSVDHRVSRAITFSGHHVKGPGDGKSTTYRGYNYTFSNLRLDDLRLSSSNTRLRNSNNNSNGRNTTNSIDTIEPVSSNRKTLKANDCVLAMWDHAKWQYFPATVVAA